MKPIREVIEEEKFGARAALRREALEQRLGAATALAVEDAVENRAVQGRIVRTLTAAAMNEYVEVHNAKATLLADTDEAKALRRSHREYSDILGKLSEILERGAKMESIILGTPTSIVRIGGEVTLRPASPEETTPEQAEVVAKALQRAIEYERQEVSEQKLIGSGNGTSDGAGAKPN